MDRLKKLRDGMKGRSAMHPLERKAKMGVVDDLSKMAEDAMGGKLKGLQRVSVAADSPEHLEDGLDKARDVLKGLPDAIDDTHPDHEDFEHTEHAEDGEDGASDLEADGDDHGLDADPAEMHEEGEEHDGEGEMDHEAIDQEIQRLMALKKHMQSKA